MALDKAIKHKKEKRKPYRGSKAFDPTCRNHGGCPACEDNRKYQEKKLLEMSDSIMEEYEEAYEELAKGKED